LLKQSAPLLKSPHRMSKIAHQSAALERLISALLTDTDTLYFGRSELNGRCNFRVGVGIREVGQVVGVGGQHFRAIRLIAEQMGRQQDSLWTVKLEEPEGERQPPYPRTPMPPEHSTRDDETLLEDVLDALGIEAEVLVGGGLLAGYVFAVRPFTMLDHAKLTDPWPAIYDRPKRLAPGEVPPPPLHHLNLLAAITLLFKAIGRKQGCEYRVTLQ